MASPLCEIAGVGCPKSPIDHAPVGGIRLLEWRRWRLLFTGDAEHRSWKEMNKRGVLKPVHFLKVSHHGSWNGTPSGEILDKILPPTPPDRRKRHAAVSTCEGA